MTERERLIELLKNDNCPSPFICDANCKYINSENCLAERIADYLLEKNVFITPVTEGDSVYIIMFNRVIPFDVISVSLFRKILIYKAQHGIHLTWVFKMEDFGKTVFLTREEAEKALAERIEHND